MDIKKEKKEKNTSEVYFFLNRVKAFTPLLFELNLLKKNCKKECLSYLGMKNAKSNWYTFGITPKYKVMLQLIEKLEESNKNAKRLQEQVNKFLNK
jgi:hypothetical protein